MRKGRHMFDSVPRRIRYLKQPGLAARWSVLRRILAANTFALWLSLAAPFKSCTAQVSENQQGTAADLKQLSLGQLGDLEVTTASKEPEEVWRTAAAIYVLTQEDIRRSGATSVPEALRLVPGVEVARIDSSTWAVGIRGFGSGFSKSVLVLIDGRNVYTPLFAGVNWKLQNVMLEVARRPEILCAKQTHDFHGSIKKERPGKETLKPQRVQQDPLRARARLRRCPGKRKSRSEATHHDCLRP
jgi:hypothetical protein